MPWRIGFLEMDIRVTGKPTPDRPLDLVPLPDRTSCRCTGIEAALHGLPPSHRIPPYFTRLPGVCSFCSKLTFGTRVRYFSTERILEEFFLSATATAPASGSMDDNFVSNPDVALAVCDGLRRGNSAHWSVRPDRRHRPRVPCGLKAAAALHCLCIESGKQSDSRYIPQTIYQEQIREVVHEKGSAFLFVATTYCSASPARTSARWKRR